MATPTYDDANLLIQMAQWGSSSGAFDAMNWLWGHGPITDYEAFTADNPPGSEGFKQVSMIAAFFETLGTLYKHELFNGELLYDWLAVGMVWNMVKEFAWGQRAAAGIDGLYINFEAMAEDAPA